ncbi:MAG: GntR family transcriptional regulator [Aeromicrobium sp.]
MSKVDYVVGRVREEIDTGQLETGEPLRQVELAERYGVSATPVREALRLLAAEGLVAYVQHRGVSVAEMRPESVRDLYRLRSVSEGLAVELAVARMQPDRLAAIRAAHDALAATRGDGDPTELSALNRAFHFSIYDSGSEVITRQLRHIWTALPARHTLWTAKDSTRVLLREHAQILVAIEQGDALGAGRLMAAHVMTAGRLRAFGGDARSEEGAAR